MMRRSIAIAAIATVLTVPCASLALGNEGSRLITPAAVGDVEFVAERVAKSNPTATAKSSEPVESQDTEAGKDANPGAADHGDADFVARRIPIVQA